MPPALTVTRTSSLLNDGDEAGIHDPGDTVAIRILIQNSGDTTLNNVSVEDVTSGLTAVGGTLNISPLANNDSFTTVGNTVLRVGEAGQTAVGVGGNIGTGPSYEFNGNLLANDVSIPGDMAAAFQIVTVSNGVSAGGGTFNVFADGSFNYVNQAGDTGTDSFTYTITDGGLDGNFATTADNLTSVGTVTITLSGEVWYVDAAAGPGGTGTSANPFSSITALNTANLDGANDTIYVEGNASGGIVLDAGQSLIGSGADLTVNGLAVESATANSTITSSTNNAFVVTVGSNATIAGINISGTGTNTGGITDNEAASFGTLSLNPAALNPGAPAYQSTVTATGAALSLSNGAIAGNGFSSTTSIGGVGTANNLSLTDVSGTLALGTGTMNGATGTSINIVNTTGAALNTGLTYAGGVTQGSNAALLNVDGGVGGHTGTIALNGTKSATNGTGLNFENADGTYSITGATTLAGGNAGIDIVSNTGGNSAQGSNGTFTFGGTFGIISPTGTAIEISDGTATVNADIDVGQASNASALAVTNHTGGTLTFQTTASFNVTNGNGLQFTNADGIYAMNSANTLGGSDGGIDILGDSSGTFGFLVNTSINNSGPGTSFNVAASDANVTFSGTIVDNNGRAVSIDDHDAGTITFTSQSSITGSGASAQGIHITNSNGGDVNFNGQVQLNTGANNAITLTTNNGSTVDFAADDLGLDIVTTTGRGIDANNGGTITIADTGSGNTISSSGGIAFNAVGGTTIGAGGVTFDSISAFGGTSGIVLNGTGTGGFTVLGGTGLTRDNSGGAIMNMTGNGIDLTNAQNVNIDQMMISSNLGSGVFGSNVTNFTLTRSHITNNGNQNGGGIEEGNVRFNNLLGSATINDNAISGGYTENVRVMNTSGTLDRLNMTSNTFGTINATGGNDNVHFEVANAGVMKLNLSSNTFAGTRGDFIEAIANNNATLEVAVRGNDMNNGQAIIPGGGVGVSVRSGSAGLASAATTRFDIANNTINDGGANAFDTVGIFVAKGQDNGTMTGSITGNTLVAATNSNSDGIFVRAAGGGTSTVLIQNNLITNWGNAGIHLQNNDGSSTMNASLFGNTVNAPGYDFNTFAALFADNGGTASDTSVMNLVVGSATVPGQQNIFDTGGVGIFDVSLGVFNGSTPMNLSRNGSAGGNYETVIHDGNVGSPFTDATAGLGTPTLVNTLPPLPPALAFLLAESAPIAEPDSGAGDPPAPTPEPEADTGSATPPPPAPEPEPQPEPEPNPVPVVIDDGVLSQAELDLVVGAAIERWAAAGATAEQVAAMRAVDFTVANLGALQLGESGLGSITIDDNAAGWNWFVDATPGDDSEYTGSGTRLQAADAYGQAGTRIDLLTVVTHELGHQIGLTDTLAGSERDALMYGTVAAGERRLPGSHETAAASGEAVAGAFALSPINLGTLQPGQQVTVEYQATVDAPGEDRLAGYIRGQATGDSDETAATPSTANVTAIDALTLGNLVFNDVNQNGAFDAGDSGVAGVTLALFADTDNNGVYDDGTDLAIVFDDNNANGVYDVGIDDPLAAGTVSSPGVDAVQLTAVTDAGGIYSFAGLAPGDYIVRIDASNFSGAGSLLGLQASATTVPEPLDPDDNVDNDDNGARVPGDAAYSNAVTLGYGAEPTAGDTNNTVDFAFRAADQAPTLSATAANPTYTENGVAVDLFSGVSASTVEAGQSFTGMTLVVTNVTDGADEILSIDGSDVALTNGNAVTTVGNSLGVSVTVAAGTATVSFSGAALNAATLQGLVDGLGYRNASEDPTDANRVVTITELVDSGRSTAPDDNSAALAIASTVNVDPVNDEPAGGDETIVVSEDDVHVFSLSDFNFSDTDGDSLAAVVITTSATAGTLALNGTAIIGVNTLVTAADIAGGLLTFTPAADANGSGYASFTFQVRDDGGTANGGIDTDATPNTMTIDVTAVNDAPVNVVGATVNATEDATNVVLSTTGSAMSVGDVEATGDISYNLTVSNGTLTILTGVPGGIQASDIQAIPGTGNGTSTIVIQATIAEINTTLASANGLVYTPNANYNGTDTLEVYANDGGQTGLDPNSSSVLPDPLIGPNTEEDYDTRDIVVAAVNDAPVVAGDGTEQAATIVEDAPDPSGQTVSSLFSGQYSDAADAQFSLSNPGGSSPGTFGGIAVVANGSSGVTGQWQYYNSGTSTWVDIGAVSAGSALLVGSGTSIRFDPAPDFNGVAPTLTAHLIDNSLGFGITFGQLVDISGPGATGGTTAYSTGTVVLSQTVTPDGVNDGTSGNDTLTGTPTNDVFDVSQGGDDTVVGLAGSDIIYYGGAFTAADQNDGGPEGRDAVVLQGNYNVTLGALSLVNIEYLSLQSGSVTKFGQDGTNSYDYTITTVDANALPSPPGLKLAINGQSLQAGEDLTFDGSAEADGGSYLVYAGFGTDTLTGGNGGDVFHFEGARLGAGDTVDGGLGMDAVVISMGTGPNYVAFGETQLTSIEAISVNNRYASDPLATPSYELVLRNGNVTAGGSLIVNGSSLTVPQTIDVDGSLVVDGSLTLYGGQGDDTFAGGALGDLIYAAGGSDESTGGLGSDTFQYRNIADSALGAEDAILDFEVGLDRIDLSLIDAQAGGANNAFGFIGAAAFSGAAGELRAELIGGVWNVAGDVDGDGGADFLILVTATTADPLTSADFIL